MFIRIALRVFIAIALTLVQASAMTLWAVDFPQASGTPAATSNLSISQSGLSALQLRLDSLKQQISSASSYNQLEGPQDQVQAFILDIDQLSHTLLPEQAQLSAQLGVIGTGPVEKTAPELSGISEQRALLSAQKNQIDATLGVLAALKESAIELLNQIAIIRRNLLESELTLRTPSILGTDFWKPLFAPSTQDLQKLAVFIDQVADTAAVAWQPGQRLYSTVLAILALFIWLPGRRYAVRILSWFCIHRMPDGRLRRSSLALASVFSTIVTTACALQLLFHACTRNQPLTPMLATFSDEFEKVVYICVLITGLSRALLSADHPSWRLPSISNSLALALKPFPMQLAGTLLVLMTLMQMINAAGVSGQSVITGRGIVALAVTGVIALGLLRIAKTRRAAESAKESAPVGSTLYGLLYTITCIAAVISLLALLTGYVSLARFITYEVVWVLIIFSGFYLLMQLFRDSCEYLLSPKNASGKSLGQVLGISDTRLEQVSIVVSGIGRAAILLLAVITLFVGGLGTTMGQLVHNIVTILGGAGLRNFNIIPGHLLNAGLALLVGIYLVRSLGRWLDNEFLPKTNMDPGMQASLSTLYANIGYALVILIALSSLGVEWTNLAWIVSALSVGIGFGLQEIVKNFVSGLILLTERPVKVGDLISISGVEGDIRRINVRATEIQLSDRSIVIVPNSQLISQNLRNVTLGGSAQGVATLELLFPLDIDSEQVQTLLYDAYYEHEHILARPAPFVRFSKLTPDGITLTVTGYVSSPRIVGTTKSDLLFDILKRLGAADIALAKPASTV
jgi:small-conductance mechanosensitive channel